MYILALIIALLASFLLTPYIKQLAVKIGAVDKPDKRKVHTQVMPRLGGLAIYLASVLLVAALLLSLRVGRVPKAAAAGA